MILRKFTNTRFFVSLRYKKHQWNNLKNRYLNLQLIRIYKNIEASTQILNLGLTSEGQIYVLSMVKNENDIIDGWLSHLAKNRIKLIVVDHQSSQLTASKLKNYVNSWGGAYFTMTENGYFQREAMFWMLNFLKNSNAESSSIVIPLDCDEFLSDKCISTIVNLFNSEQISAVGLPWRNAYPTDFLNEKLRINNNTKLHISVEKSPVWKSASSLRIIRKKDLNWAQGNHLLFNRIGNWQRPEFVEDIEILHIPIRTRSQLEDKISSGILSYQKRGKNDGNGFHWKQMKDLVKDENFEIRSITFHYGTAFIREYVRPDDFVISSLEKVLING